MATLLSRCTLLALGALSLSACGLVDKLKAAIPTPTPPAPGLASGPWKPSGTVQVASVTNGPWTLGQSGATLGQPLAGYCAPFGQGGALQPNTGTHLMQPYYFPFVTGSGQNLDGWFDYRVKDQDEAVVHGTSKDAGLTWSVDPPKLRLNGRTCPADAATPVGNDNGQGHPVVLTVPTKGGTRTLLHTLDRAAAVVDSGGLLVHDLNGALPADEPVSHAAPVPAGVAQTNGLQHPDGILGAVPGSGTDTAGNPLKVLYLKKIKGSAKAPAAGLDPAKLCTDAQSAPLTGKKANDDRTELRLASTQDGLTFSDLGPVTGLNNPDDNAAGGFRDVGPRGTLLKYADGSYGLFFAGGNCSDGDSDAYHFIGSAHSPDLLSWTVDNGPSNPLVQVDYSHPNSLPQAYFSGRVYVPNVVVNSDGRARLIFSGYRSGAPLPKTGAAGAFGTPPRTWQAGDPANYRSMLLLDLKR